ncbi:MAG: ISKra4 family transposase, partial [Rhodothermia bacterium]|nr:ISKra4 family transposase [Rhodothermia bacterium]MBN8589854.1 ISKra4 family transposase [Rhodothermia bacterium]
DRMNYPSYLKRGLCIGNGAMEAANRTLVQTRCKRSGQRWSEQGVNHILNLRCAWQSNNWTCVTKLLVEH